MVDLDIEQEAVVSKAGSVFIEAGPGSGKTRVLTEKARKIFKEGKSLICLCFTRAAAKEMASRVPGIPATTIHSFCHSVVGWDPQWEYTGLLSRYLNEKDKLKFDYVLIDEAQDLNPLELDVVLSMRGEYLFAVGDPYQSIYGFQGALGPSIVKILKDEECKRTVLHNNYRSCEYIVYKLNSYYDRNLVSKQVKSNLLNFILCRKNEDVIYLSQTLKDLAIPHRLRMSSDENLSRERFILGTSNYILMTIHQSKGLEADRVILFDWEPDYEMPEECRIFYVAMSRASQEFHEINRVEELLDLLGVRNAKDKT